MWTVGLTFTALLLALYLILANAGVDPSSPPPTSKSSHDSHTKIKRAARELKKATRNGVKLIETRNINRGADGTVTKDMNRGPPLKALLPEDTDDGSDGWDDDEWYEDDADVPYEEKQLELKAKEQKEAEERAARKKKHEELLKKFKEKVSDNAAAKKKKMELDKLEKEKEERDKKEKEEEEAKENKRRAAKHVPRRWESNAVAVMKIIDLDAHPDAGVNLTGKGKMIKPEEDSEDSEDSSDDEEEEQINPDQYKYTYLSLPNLSTKSADEAAHAILSSSTGITHPLQSRLSSMFAKATSHECRTKIAEHFALFVNGLAEETKFPFEDFHYPNTCDAIPRYADWENLPEGVKVNDVQYRTYQPPKESVPEGTYIENVEELRLLYVILTHDRPESTVRLMESVFVPDVTNFVIHVDGKEKSDDTYDKLVEYAFTKNTAAKDEGKEEYIRIVPTEKRVRVNWGGFSMVDATLKALHTAFGLDYYDEHPDEEDEEGVPIDNPHAFQFHKLIHIASTTYPLASNTEIRDTLASYPLDANFLHIILRPNNPTPSVWNYFVECDDALHRIYRLPALNYDRGNGVDIYTSSQWFIIARDFAWYLANPPEGSFVEYYLQYIEHVVVADEAFFGTVVRNTHFCGTLHNDNFLHLQFDRWENEATGKRDQRKCVMKNRDHCGRSPTTMTVDYLPVLELSGDLFARKFDDEVEPHIKDYIDKRRVKEEERFLREAKLIKEAKEKSDGTEAEAALPLEDWEFQGEGVLIVAKETLQDEVPLCMGLAEEGNRILLQPCFKEDVPASLSPDWESGAVIIEEIEGLNRWDIGPCSSDGELKSIDTGELEMIPGEYSEKGPSCGIKLGDGPRRGRCIDVQSEQKGPGGLLHVFPCYTRWHQMYSFGNGTIAPRGAIHASLPFHITRELRKKNEGEVHQHLCLGVVGRGDADETWIEYTEEEMEEYDPWEYDDVEVYPNGRKSLQLWSGEQLQTTPCSNEGGVIEWFYVPFIVEEYDEEHEAEANPEDMTETDEEL